MKIALAQLNYHIGNFDHNSKKIINAIKEAEQENIDLIIFSELSICGYCPLDLLEQKSFIKNCLKTLDHIKTFTQNIGVILGLPTINEKEKGKNLFNSAAFIYQGTVKKIFNKTLLPTYDIFDEYRYFEPNNIFELLEFKNKKIAVTICEDLWDDQKVYGNFDKEALYKNAPLEHLSKLNPDFVINISASPYSYNQAKDREEIIVKNAIKYSFPIIYVNQTGANTDLIFDGGSFVVDKKGNKILGCRYFEEDVRHIDLNNQDTYYKNIPEIPDKIEGIYNALVLGIKDYFAKSGLKNAVIGLSGGIDSAVTLAIIIEALGNENVTTLLMPTKYSSQHSIDDSIEMANRCNVNYHILNIEKLRIEFDKTLHDIFINTKPNVTEENIQARIRGNILMAYSNKFGNIVLNTSNKSELAVGYSTLYGDMNGALSVLGDVYKTDVYKLANYINKTKGNIIPENIIIKEPSAELRPDQKDNDSLPDYDVLDSVLFAYIEQKLSTEEIKYKGINTEIVDHILRLVNFSEYKRSQAPPTLRVSSKAFGSGRKMPIVAKFN
ncbi:MAG: NAD+ synthase [Bacteroidales bacterium]|jgi:NAD+ synthase (glutamine-hydrolysing)|nr:NAD+ synthase [Bacteroidales bacterium]